MRITREELTVSIPRNNYVLCKSVLETDKITLAGQELYIDNKFKPEWHQPVMQKVVSFNKRLTYGKRRQNVVIEHGNKGLPEYRLDGKKNPFFDFWYETTSADVAIDGSMPWQTTMEVRRDDIVWVDFVSVFNAEKNGRKLEVEDEVYYLIPYQDIYCLINDKGIKVLNGWILVEPVDYFKDKVSAIAEKAGLDVVKGRAGDVAKDTYGIVRHIGLPVTEYLHKDQFDTDEVSEGDVVLMKFMYNRRMESVYHIKFGERMLVVTRRSWIAGIIKDGKLKA